MRKLWYNVHGLKYCINLCRQRSIIAFRFANKGFNSLFTNQKEKISHGIDIDIGLTLI